jgi:hypothetical protein
MLAVNLRGVILGVRAALSALRAAGGGSIVVTASVSGLFGDPGMWAYNASKGGAVNFVRAAALDLAPDGIRVNAVCPGGIAGTGMSRPMERHAPELFEEMRSHVPMQRWGRADEVAAAIAFLLSPDASFVTGVALPVDGGVSAGTGQFRARPPADGPTGPLRHLARELAQVEVVAPDGHQAVAHLEEAGDAHATSLPFFIQKRSMRSFMTVLPCSTWCRTSHSMRSASCANGRASPAPRRAR